MTSSRFAHLSNKMKEQTHFQPKNFNWSIPVLLVLTTLFSCQTNKISYIDSQVIQAAADDENQEELDSLLEIEYVGDGEDRERYRSSATRFFDVLHTDLDLAFDWKSQTVSGEAILTLKPFFKTQNTLVLDAQDFDFQGIYLLGQAEKLELGYFYEQNQVHITLPRAYTRVDTLKIQLNYTAFPEKNSGNGSAAISDTKGLYFIDPLDTIPDKPSMIWTQGETAHNSKWFPTVDHPNERFTQAIKLTVADSMKTISNGILVKQEKLPNGLRKDHWEMNIPHAPYLAAVAVGDFGRVESRWKDIPLSYYVEKGYEKGAEKVFENTPEMMELFSDLLGIKFPWPKYDQIVVRDFVSGAMENTTASIFMEELRLDEREALDSEWDYIIAHELFHQWFGDYVTSESWSNLTLNEAFANYGEYLWNEKKYGQDQAKLSFLTEAETYFTESEYKQVDLIRFQYETAEDMFDAHSYSKGGWVLHMLRTYLGDEAFFEGLHFYLKTNALQSVEVHDLRLAMEKVSGEDLNWFFNQWFLDKGHPELSAKIDYSNPRDVSIRIEQTQDLSETPLYKFPLEISWYEGKTRKSKIVTIERATEQIQLKNEFPVDVVYLDESKDLLAKWTIEREAVELVKQFNQSVSGVARYEAFSTFTAAGGHEEELQSILPAALSDPFWSIREFALLYLESNPEHLDALVGLEEKVYELADSNERNSVRAGAIDLLAKIDPEKYQTSFLRYVNHPSYLVASSALTGIMSSETLTLKKEISERFAGEKNFRMILPLAGHYISDGIEGKGDWFRAKTSVLGGQSLYYFLGYYSDYFNKFPGEGREEALSYLFGLMRYDSKDYIRFGAFEGLLGYVDDEEVLAKIVEYSSYETDPLLQNYMSSFLKSLKDEN
jgi:aminopeptidase N